MKAAALLILSLLCLGAFAQNEVKQVLDSFAADTTVIVIVVPGTGVPTGGISENGFTDSPDIGLGSERDLEMRVESGVPSAVFSTGVNNDQWSVSSPQDARGFALMQYDGADGSIVLQENGLNNRDLTANGATAFRFEIESDLDTVYRFDVYCSAGNSFVDQDIPGQDGVQVQYEIPFSSFSGPCDFTSIGAMEILIEAFDNVDTIITEFVTVGPPNPSGTPTPTPTRTPAGTASNTPTPTGTPTGVPTDSNTPSPTPTCECFCPLFNCELLFATPGDDDDGYDDDNGDPDDDDDQLFSYGPYGNHIANPSRLDSSNDDDDSSSSDATVITVSVLSALAIVAALF